MSDNYTKDGRLIIKDDVERINKLRHLNLSDTICPICHTKTVNKNMRQCTKCHQVLLWSEIDDAQFAIENMDDFYMWHKSIFGLSAWYHSSYFDVKSRTTQHSNVEEFCRLNKIKI
jgi:hypothetical protein